MGSGTMIQQTKPYVTSDVQGQKLKHEKHFNILI
jgi:hypothetical protein